jgi:hypothetical protein
MPSADRWLSLMDGWLRKPRGGGSDGLEDLPRGDAALAYGVSE